MRVAIIGAGVSGLTAAHLLHASHDITVFESADRAGGHANTLTVDDNGRELPIDTGFIVYNERTYPLFTRLLASLGVATQPSEMSFSVSCRGCGLCYSGRGLSGLLAQPTNVFRPRYARLLTDIIRFNRWASGVELGTLDPAATLAEAIADRGLSPYFAQHYIVPMTSAIWSSSSSLAEEFPLSLFLRFFRNHGLLQVRNQPQWRTVTGGSREYVRRLLAPFRSRVRLSAAVSSVRRVPQGVEVVWAGGREVYDRVVMATHADRTRAILREPTAAEGEAFEQIPYVANEAILHTDTRRLPPMRQAWSAWNYAMPTCVATGQPPQLTYYMNALQRLDTARHYCVTLNSDADIEPSRILARVPYRHPVYTVKGVEARRRLRDISGHGGIHYCGAYLGNGFHEDGVRSSHDAVAELGVQLAMGA